MNEPKYLHTCLLQVTKEMNVDGNRVDVYVENGLSARPFKTVQAAIDAASSGTDITIVPKPGGYVEDITLKAGVNLKSVFDTTFRTVMIKGKVTLDITGSVLVSGNHFYNDSDHVLDYKGTNKQKIFAHNTKFESNSPGAHHAINHANTNIDSEILLKDSMTQVLNTSGGAKPIETGATSQGLIGLDNSTVRITDDIDNVALNLRGAISYWHRMDEIRGRVKVDDVASCNICLDGIYTNEQSCLETNSMGLSILTSVILSTAAKPAVTGAGVFAYSQIGYARGGMGLADTLNGGAGPTVGVLPTESLILTSADGTKWKLTVGNDGVLDPRVVA